MLLLIMLGNHVLLVQMLVPCLLDQLHRFGWGLLCVVNLSVALSRGCLRSSIGGVIHRASLIIFYNFISRT
jgi:hypothetical protein